MLEPLRGQQRALGRRTKTPPAYTAMFPAGSVSWTAPKPGRYKFLLWGAGYGGASGQGNASGSLAVTTVQLAAGQVIAGTVALGGPGAPSGNSSLTFPDGRSVVAGSATGVATPGTATGGDTNLAGSVGGSSGGTDGIAGLGDAGGAGGIGNGIDVGGGGGAPGVSPFKGGKGGSRAGNESGGTPGGGAQGGPEGSSGGSGLLIIVKVS